MMVFLLLFLAVALTLELARRLPLLAAFRDVGRTSLRARRMLGYRRCLERRKERGLRSLSWRMLRRSLAGAGLLALVLTPLAALLAADSLLEIGVTALLLDWQARLLLLVLGLVHAFARFGFRRRLQPG